LNAGATAGAGVQARNGRSDSGAPACRRCPTRRAARSVWRVFP